MTERAAVSADLQRLRRWVDAGSTWQVLARRPDGVVPVLVPVCRAAKRRTGSAPPTPQC